MSVTLSSFTTNNNNGSRRRSISLDNSIIPPDLQGVSTNGVQITINRRVVNQINLLTDSTNLETKKCKF